MKYKLTENKMKMNNTTLYQIQAIKDFGDVEKGDFGGWIEAEENLSQSGNAWVYGKAWVCDNAKVYGNARLYGYACVYDNACVFGNTRVYGYARVYDSARVSQNQRLQNCSCKDDLSKNIKESIRCQTGLGVFNEKIVAYKTINKDMSSFQDEKFFYKVGEIAEVKNPEISNESCASGLHFSNMNYWDNKDGVFIQAEINLEDIITVQEGKIRCKKALITGIYER